LPLIWFSGVTRKKLQRGQCPFKSFTWWAKNLSCHQRAQIISREAKAFCRLNTEVVLSLVIVSERKVLPHKTHNFFSMFAAESGHAGDDYSK
jgi:hypothetical protein